MRSFGQRRIAWGLLIAASGVVAGISSIRGQSGSSATMPAATQPSTLTVQSLQVRHPDYARLTAEFMDDRLSNGRQLPAFSVTLHIHSPEKMIDTEVDIDSAVDDTGQNLRVGAAASNQPALVWPDGHNISEDHHEAFVDVTFPHGPAAGAKQVILKGDAILTVARSVRTDKMPIALAQGATLKVANTTFTIPSVTHYGDYGVTFSTGSFPRQVDGVALTDGAGKLYAGKPSRTDSLGSEYRMEFFMKELPPQAVAEVTWFDKQEPVHVPFTLTVTLGLGGANP